MLVGRGESVVRSTRESCGLLAGATAQRPSARSTNAAMSSFIFANEGSSMYIMWPDP